MIKYFINYEDLLENNILNKELNALSPELFIIRKTKNKEYTIQPLLFFIDIESKLSNYIIPINYNKKGILMVELTKEEAEKVSGIIIKKFELNENTKNYKKIIEEKDPKEIGLIDYKCLLGMNATEMDLGEIVAVMPCKSDPERLYVSLDRSNLLNKFTLRDRRMYLKNKEIGCDLYFYTENEELLDKFKDDVTKLKRIEPNKFELIKHKLFVIDSIPQNRVYDFNSQTKKCFFELCNSNSIPVNIINDGDNYNLNIHDVDNREQKGYIITNDNIKNILYDKAIEPLLNYINVYILENGTYKKISIVDYVSKTSTIKLHKNKKTSEY